jgi:hypothetical protein
VSQRLPWIVAGVGGLAVAGVLLSRGGRAVLHPEPRPGVTAERVLPPSLVLTTPAEAAAAYAAARGAPQLLDGLYCHCECAKHFGHRSLLTCFESDHGGQCDICMGEALLATRMASGGSTLDQIRRAIDERFHS